jgi:hypothetical protein
VFCSVTATEAPWWRPHIGDSDMVISYSLTPLSDSDAEATRSRLIEYWTAIVQSEELTGVLGDLVHETQARVTELLSTNEICDVYEANIITARFDGTLPSSS